MTFGAATTAKIDEVVEACQLYGPDSIILLSGVAGTGKTLIALAAAQKHAGHPLFVKEIQFHPSFSYDDLIEGLRPTGSGGFEPRAGIFLEWNQAALLDPDHRYVLLIEEFTRANITGVLGELMTYLEHRDRFFETPITRQRVRVAKNLTVLATMNPRDRSALEIDDALIRRLRLLSCPPSIEQLREMLQNSLPGKGENDPERQIMTGLVRLFEETKQKHPETFEEMMPFGHGMFANMRSVRDLYHVWHHRIKHLLRRPQVPAHPYAEDIERLYPWKTPPAAGQ